MFTGAAAGLRVSADTLRSAGRAFGRSDVDGADEILRSAGRARGRVVGADDGRELGRSDVDGATLRSEMNLRRPPRLLGPPRPRPAPAAPNAISLVNRENIIASF